MLDIKDIQELLIEKKLFKGEVTGKYDDNTRVAVEEYQKKLKEKGFYKRTPNGNWDVYTELAHNQCDKSDSKDKKPEKTNKK